jgi:hypothetical protein
MFPVMAPTPSPAPVPQRTGPRRLVGYGIWLAAVIVAWLAINVGMDDPASADERFTGLWPPTHPYWFNPLIAVVALVPASVLGVRLGRAFGARSRIGSAAIAFALGIVCWCLGNLVWFWYNTCTSWGAIGCSHAVEAPYPSLADIGFLLLLPCWGFAMVQLARVLATTGRDLLRLAWIPVLALLVTGYITLPAFHLFGLRVPNHSALFDSGYDRLQETFSVFYVVSDAALLSLSLILVVRARSAVGGLYFRPMLLASGALLLQYVADLVFDVRATHGTEFAGDVADLLYFCALFTMTLALQTLSHVHARLTADLAELGPLPSRSQDEAPDPVGSPR